MIYDFRTYNLLENISIDDYSTWKKGDTIYCIWQLMSPQLKTKILFGKPYIIHAISQEENDRYSLDVEGCLFFFIRADRFTKDPNHPRLIQNRFDL